ncbi:MAG TPA: alpha/beta hydrolase fold domain-containing protein [Aliidongia sp.]|uniref:alpha/beta hydrolase n=1 Tax=Aliidongia sp. TaxID=1914230 RepID=UPI002DDD7ADF|nr:alpha/beta hydrolase fold domain-containing protein [Aliidongia sp.]HEV2677535.1 alpha/beta hydrolase fold domain-containing protein [Aliidongia sp.]
MPTHADQDSCCSVHVERNLVYATVDGTDLAGDYYRPGTAGAVPVVVAVHGGGWKLGSARFYQHWGPYLAAQGIALFAIDYRLAESAQHHYPAAADDVRAAVRFVRANAERLGIDPRRVGLIGDSAGAHLATLAALAGGGNVQDEGRSLQVKAVVAVYGVYDLVAQWQHDLQARPHDQITEIFMGHSPLDDRLRFIEASPLSHVTRQGRGTAFLVAWGTADDVVDWESQSKSFVGALKQVGCFVRTVAITDAPHFWMSDPLDDPYGYPIRLAPSLLRFLREHL